MGQLSNLVQKFGIGRLAAVAGGIAGVVAIVIAVMLRMSAEPKSLLYADLDLKEAGEITTALEQSGVKYELKGDGSTIMVERDQVASTRLMLSGQGLPSAGSVGYEIFDETSALGQTDFQQQLNRQRALEGELARTIRSLDGVSSVRVHLTLPKRELFEESAEKPTASVVVGLKRGDLAADKVVAIRNLVAGAVPGWFPAGTWSTTPADAGQRLEEGDGLTGAAADSLRSPRGKLRKKVQDIVEGVVGPARRVDVPPSSTSTGQLPSRRPRPDGRWSAPPDGGGKRRGAEPTPTAPPPPRSTSGRQEAPRSLRATRARGRRRPPTTRSLRHPTEVQEPGQ